MTKAQGAGHRDEFDEPTDAAKERAARMMQSLGWPIFIVKAKEREDHITEAMAGHRYEDVVFRKTGKWMVKE